jgi:methionine-gamma-lyase
MKNNDRVAAKRNNNFDSSCVHAGMGDYEFGPVIPPIYQTSTFKFENSAHGAALFRGDVNGYIYTRMKNPTIEALENAMAELEGGHKALGCASGMAAVNTTLVSLLRSGQHVVCSKSVYGPTSTLIETVLSKFGVESTFVNTEHIEEIISAFRPDTKLLYIETPGNPTMAVTDLAAASEFAHSRGATVVVDNTFMSPALQKPFDFGVDIILHSMTKFLNGHADVVGGIVIVRDEETYKIFRKTLNQLGGVIDPFNSFLVHRGLKTLSIRMERHCKNALPVAEYLESHPKVLWVRYPGLKSHPQYELGLKQHKGFGGMISFELKGGYKAGEVLMNSVQFCQLAVSLGGVETLIQHPASMTHLTMGEAARASAGISEGLIRLSVGIETVQDIIGDLDQSLLKVSV